MHFEGGWNCENPMTLLQAGAADLIKMFCSEMTLWKMHVGVCPTVILLFCDPCFSGSETG